MAGNSGSLVHQAFIYDSTEHFVEAMTPFALEGLERGDKVFGATTADNAAGLRERLGDAADAVELHATEDWCPRPYQRLQAVHRMVQELPAGRRLRAMGEPIWSGTPAVNRCWANYESTINDSLAAAPLRFVCLYDGSLPEAPLDHARHTHPELLEDGEPVPCGAYVSPQAFYAGSPPPPPSDAVELSIDGELRSELGRYALGAGFPAGRVDDFVLASWEANANARRHGQDPVRARAWVEDDELIVQVADGGGGPADTLAGWAPLRGRDLNGRGLPLARALSDAVEVERSAEGCTVSLFLSRQLPV